MDSLATFDVALHAVWNAVVVLTPIVAVIGVGAWMTSRSRLARRLAERVRPALEPAPNCDHRGEIVVVPFRAEHARAFYDLNRAWLDEHALYEQADEDQLADPWTHILDAGGAIFVALLGSEVVGTAAVVPHGPGEAEIAKLTVAEPARGRGLGRRLAETCLEHARAMSVRRVMLVSSSKLGAALRLYESMGFEHRTPPAPLAYATADVYMEKELP